MKERIVAISVSDGPDLSRFGFLTQHLQRLLAALAAVALRSGWRVGYGGDLRRDGFTRSLLADMAAAHARGEAGSIPLAPVVHFFAHSSWCEMPPIAVLNHLMDIDIAPSDSPISPVLETRFFAPGICDGLQSIGIIFEDGVLKRVPGRERLHTGQFLSQIEDLAKRSAESGLSLTAMRRAMAEACPLRVQFSGQVDGYRGDRPGILEEAIEHIRAGGILRPLAAFGGAAREVAIALGLLDAPRMRYEHC